MRYLSPAYRRVIQTNIEECLLLMAITSVWFEPNSVVRALYSLWDTGKLALLVVLPPEVPRPEQI